MDVVVIGAGLSGLTAASTLCEAGANVQVLEADSQIGGRIRAIRDPGNARAVADLGPTWIWPKYQPVVARWMTKLGVETFEQFNDGDAVITGYGSGPRRQPLPSQDGMMRIVGGPTTLIETLANKIGQVNIQTSTTVTEIAEDGPEHIAVRLASGKIIKTKRVIISVPLRIAATMIHLPWALPALLVTFCQVPTWMSSHAKAVALYDKPFWRDAGLSGRIASRTGPLVEVHDHTGAAHTPAALFGFVGWSADRRKAEPERLRSAILEQLTDCFGDTAAQPLDLVVQDWAMSPHIATELDTSEQAAHPQVGPASLRQSYLDGRVRFAVSEASDRSPGLIEGALTIGEQAALALLEARP